MSETVHYRGKLTEIKPTKTRDIEEISRRIFEDERGLEASEYDKKYSKTYLKILCDNLYKEYYTYKGRLFKIEKEDIDPDGDIIKASKNEDGTINFELRFYNGGSKYGRMLR